MGTRQLAPKKLTRTHLDEESRQIRLSNLLCGTNCSLRFLSSRQKTPPAPPIATPVLPPRTIPHSKRLKKHPPPPFRKTGKLNADTRLELQMKAVTLLGALVGFLIGAGFGLTGSSPWPAALWRACAAALAVALLARWWSRIWIQSLRQSLKDQQVLRHSPPAILNPSPKKL